MEKLQHDIENMVDRVSVSNKLDETVQKAIEIAKKKKRRSLIYKEKMIASLAAILILGIGTVIFFTYYPDQATNRLGDSVSYTDSVLYKTADEGLKRMAKEGKAQLLSLVSEDKGVKFFLEEGYLDDQQLAVTYRVEFDKSQIEKIDDESVINLEWFVDGKPQIEEGFGGLNTKELMDNGDVFIFDTDRGLPEEPKIDIRIKSINGIQGDWSFTFGLKKQKEFISDSKSVAKEDELGNSIVINNVNLTPSKLELNLSTTLAQKELLQDQGNTFRDLIILALGSDGFSYFETPRRSSNSENAYSTASNGTILEKIEVPRGIDTYTYKFIPFISSHKGKATAEGNEGIWDEITGPYREGTILDGNSKIKVVSIEENNQRTVIRYKMNQEPFLPIFPLLADRESNILYEAISFKKEGDFVEVNYPKIDQNTITEFVLFDATYLVLKDLETLIDLK
ncbi:DUF4179 domain-containing protein [Heyndrickxia sp. NPDC080065]|uniref:DUF4179 domain-containing protein n=1 Tax=Heyndrickxia sp. NPDC080065 TaxID=3390568 RepID=UPI003D0537A3